MAHVSIDAVRKLYGALEVIHGVSTSIADGEFVVLVGPSGCGKSTLLRMIAGLEEISGGTISIGDQVVNDVAPKDRNIAMVFQNYALYPHMTVAQNMGFSLKLRGVVKSEIKRKVGEAATILTLESLLDRYPSQLSGGQRQRVAMGRAIVRDPEVFLFDEPLSNLDAKLRVHMRAEIKELHQQLRTTTVYVTHDQVEAMTMADRIVVMRDGIIEQVGTPIELYDRPQNRFVAGFVGSPAMNFIPGRVIGGDFTGDGGICCAAPGLPDREVLAGVRPSRLVIAPDGTSASVKVIEPTGEETQVIAQLGDTEITILSRERLALRPGDSIRLQIPPGVAHFFDAENGERLELKAAGC